MIRKRRKKNITNKVTKAVLFYRVSSREQSEGYSIDAQQARLKNDYCVRKNLTVIKEFSIIESSTRGDRKKFNEMIEFIKKLKEPVAIVCDKVDRLQRGFKEIHIFDELRKSGKIELHFNVERQILTARSNSNQLSQYHLSLLTSEAYTNNISDNVNRAFEQLRREGRHIGIAPLGYINIKDGRGRSDLEVDKERAPLIYKLFEKYSTGIYSFKQIQQYSIDIGLRNKRTGRPLTISQIEYLLQNEFYIGRCYNSKEDIWVDHPYHTIIPIGLFEKCQQVAKKRSHNYSNTTRNSFIFSGLIKCKNCGCTITPEIKKGKYVYLRPFPKKLPDGSKCNCKMINENIALNLVSDVISKISFNKELLASVLKDVKSRIDIIQGYQQNAIVNMQKKLEKLEKQKDRLLELYTNSDCISIEDFNKRTNSIQNEQNILKTKIQQQSFNPTTVDVTLDYLISLAMKLPDIFKSSRNAEKRELLSLIFSNFWLDGSNLLYTLRSPFDLLSKWASYPYTLGRKDSNLRMPGPKPGALPLGDVPILLVTFIILNAKSLMSIFMFE